jgi:hypothetical protein
MDSPSTGTSTDKNICFPNRLAVNLVYISYRMGTRKVPSCSHKCWAMESAVSAPDDRNRDVAEPGLAGFKEENIIKEQHHHQTRVRVQDIEQMVGENIQ